MRWVSKSTIQIVDWVSEDCSKGLAKFAISIFHIVANEAGCERLFSLVKERTKDWRHASLLWDQLDEDETERRRALVQSEGQGVEMARWIAAEWEAKARSGEMGSLDNTTTTVVSLNNLNWAHLIPPHRLHVLDSDPQRSGNLCHLQNYLGILTSLWSLVESRWCGGQLIEEEEQYVAVMALLDTEDDSLDEIFQP
jgi:hypothetical protein